MFAAIEEEIVALAPVGVVRQESGCAARVSCVQTRYTRQLFLLAERVVRAPSRGYSHGEQRRTSLSYRWSALMSETERRCRLAHRPEPCSSEPTAGWYINMRLLVYRWGHAVGGIVCLHCVCHREFLPWRLRRTDETVNRQRDKSRVSHSFVSVVSLRMTKMAACVESH